MTAELIWILFGLALVVAEFVISGFFIIFFGLAAIMVGVFLWAGMPGDNGIPFLVFTVLAVAMMLFLRSHFRGWFGGNATEGPDGVHEDILGHEATVVDGFGPSQRGKVEYRGARWSARSAAELAVGDIVTITGRDGLTLDVSPT